MNSYTRKNFGHDEEIIKVSEDPNEPIDLSNDPEGTTYSVDTHEDYLEFMKRYKL